MDLDSKALIDSAAFSCVTPPVYQGLRHSKGRIVVKHSHET